ITADAVRQLRERTGAGMMECKKALVETKGDLDAAAELMRRQGLAKADKKAARVAAEGVIVIERSADARAAAMVEINCETDFVARGDDFRAFAKAVGEAALKARAEVVARERDILTQQAKSEGKPPEIVAKMVEGRLRKALNEVTLAGQAFVKDPDVSIEKLLKSAGAEVVAFERFEVGAGIEKKTED